jgi:hypothetical protein
MPRIPATTAPRFQSAFGPESSAIRSTATASEPVPQAPDLHDDERAEGVKDFGVVGPQT